MKKTISIILSFVILISSVCALDLTVFARDDDKFTYTYDEKTSTLVINGKGVMNYGTFTAESIFEEDIEIYQIFSNAKKVIISEGITGIERNCFGYLIKVEEITFPSTLKYIYGYSADNLAGGGFCGLKYLKKVTFKNGLEIIQDAFEGCPNLESLTFPNTMKTIDLGRGEYYPRVGETIQNNAVINSIPNSVKTLCISNWNGLKSLTLPSGIKVFRIESCKNLQTVTISAGTEYKIDSNYLISDCPNLKSLYVYSMNISFGNNANIYGSNCKNAVTYCYQGTQVYNNCKKNNYKVSVITQPTTILPTVTGLKATGSDTKQIDLTWNAVSGATGYRIEVYRNGQYVYYGLTKTNKVSVTGLNNAQAYRIRVRAYKTVNGKNYWGQAWVAVTYATRAAIPSNFRATGSNNSVIYLSWNKNTRATGYKVFIYDTAKKSYVLYKDIKGASNTSVSVTGLKNNTKYQFKIYAYLTYAGVTYNGYCSGALSASTKLNMVTVNSIASNSTKRITVKWNRALYTCTGYEVMWSTTSNFSSNYLSVYVKGRDTLSTTLTTAQSGRYYYVRVRAYTESNSKKTYGSWGAVQKVKVK